LLAVEQLENFLLNLGVALLNFGVSFLNRGVSRYEPSGRMIRHARYLSGTAAASSALIKAMNLL
jgi:hypothetical protein